MTINRGQGNLQIFNGTARAETSSHYRVTWIEQSDGSKNNIGECFAKNSLCVNFKKGWV